MSSFQNMFVTDKQTLPGSFFVYVVSKSIKENKPQNSNYSKQVHAFLLTLR